VKPDTRIICGLDPLRQEPSGPRLAVDNTADLASLQAEREAALAAYREAHQERRRAEERVIDALHRILLARAALDRACGRRPRCE
jgi:beta-glucosidase-like glycosyl hydrolase